MLRWSVFLSAVNEKISSLRNISGLGNFVGYFRYDFDKGWDYSPSDFPNGIKLSEEVRILLQDVEKDAEKFYVGSPADEKKVIGLLKRILSYGWSNDKSSYLLEYKRDRITCLLLVNIREATNSVSVYIYEEEQMNMQDIIFDYIYKYIIEHGYSPSVREIGDGVGLKSTSSVHRHLSNMFNNGMLETDVESQGTPRAIRLGGYEVKLIKKENT